MILSNQNQNDARLAKEKQYTSLYRGAKVNILVVSCVERGKFPYQMNEVKTQGSGKRGKQ